MRTITPPTAPAPTPPMKNRVIRSDDDTWDDAMAQARADGIELAGVVRHYLSVYGAKQRKARESAAKRQSSESSKRQSRDPVKGSSATEPARKRQSR